jgi:biopolymer transport protein ExbB
MVLTFSEVLKAAGVFAYPLLGCSILALAIFIERTFSLFFRQVFPTPLLDALVAGEVNQVAADLRNAGGRIVNFYRGNSSDPDGLKAYARLEISRLERGIFLLDIIVAVAPLLGLLGTVTGLVGVFSGFDAESTLADTAQFGKGISLALSTTILGLATAIPAIAAATWFDRRIDVLASRIDVGVELLLESSREGSFAGD